MKKQQVTDIFFYKWRYFFGYLGLALIYVGAVVVSAIYAPGGLTQSEIDTLKITNELAPSLDKLAIANLPFYLTQLASLKIFGVSILAIKAPAILFSIIGSLAIFSLLKQWFKSSITILSLLIMATTGQLLFVGQNATPNILYITYSALILLFVTLILRRAKFNQLWRLGLIVTVAVSLFTPYFWYINLGLFLIAFLHPHPRHFLLSKKHRKKWLLAGTVFILFISGFVYACFRSTSFAKSLIGIDTLSFDFQNNLKLLYYSYFRPEPSVVNGQITPIIDFSALLLMLLGLMKSFQKGRTARSFMIWSWLILALALLAVRPQLTAIITVPLFILLAVGIETLFDEWYKLFPKNPYARGTGLMLISTLIIIMTLGGAIRYIDGYRYYPLAVNQFNKDLSLITTALSPQDSAVIVVSENEAPIYAALAKHDYPNLTVSQQAPAAANQTIYISKSARQQSAANRRSNPSSILTNGASTNGDRFYIYKSQPK